MANTVRKCNHLNITTCSIINHLLVRLDHVINSCNFIGSNANTSSIVDSKIIKNHDPLFKSSYGSRACWKLVVKHLTYNSYVRGYPGLSTSQRLTHTCHVTQHVTSTVFSGKPRVHKSFEVVRWRPFVLNTTSSRLVALT